METRGINVIRFLLMLFLVNVSAAGQVPDLSGIVGDTTGGPLPGVRVSLIDASTGRLVEISQTDESGEYSFHCVQTGLYDLTFELHGFLKQSLHGINVEYPTHWGLVYGTTMYIARPTKSESLTEPKATVTTIYVVDLESGSPLPSAEVHIDDYEPEFQPRATDNCGRTWASLLHDVRNQITVSRPGYRPQQLEVLVDPQPLLKLMVELERQQ